jgi:hypothetical protein
MPAAPHRRYQMSSWLRIGIEKVFLAWIGAPRVVACILSRLGTCKFSAGEAIAVGEDLKHGALFRLIEARNILGIDDQQPAFTLALRDAEVQYLEQRPVEIGVLQQHLLDYGDEERESRLSASGLLRQKLNQGK